MAGDDQTQSHELAMEPYVELSTSSSSQKGRSAHEQHPHRKIGVTGVDTQGQETSGEGVRLRHQPEAISHNKRESTNEPQKNSASN